MSARTVSRLEVTSRIAAGVVGGYAFTWGFIALGVAALFAVGMPFHDAEALSYILGFLLFLTMFCWAFAAGSVTRVWLVLGMGGALMAGVATLVQRTLL